MDCALSTLLSIPKRSLWLNSSNSNQTKIGYFQPPFIVAPTAARYQMQALTSSLRVFFFRKGSQSRDKCPRNRYHERMKKVKKNSWKHEVMDSELKNNLWIQKNSLSHGKTCENTNMWVKTCEITTYVKVMDSEEFTELRKNSWKNN